MRKLLSASRLLFTSKRLSASGILLLSSAFVMNSYAASLAPRTAPEFVIQHTNGKQTLLSSFRGKPVVMALMYATCPHCQHTAGLLNGMQGEFASKGVQFLGATFGDGDAMRIDAFVRQFKINFDCGYSSIPAVLSFLQMDQGEPYFVPILLFIDKKGVIQKQVIGDEKFYAEKDQAANIRAEIEKLVKSPSPTSSTARHKKAASE